MKKTLVTLVFIIILAAYSLYQYFGTSSHMAYVASSNTLPVGTATGVVTQPIIPPKEVTTATSPTQTSTETTPTPTPILVPTPVVKKNLYADGTYTGSVADAYYGNIQVQTTITNGKIVNVVFLQYPNDRSTSRYINGVAMPRLKSEAIAAQNANVNIVSGATDSSQAFRESLGNALNQAKNA